ncbi:MAG: hypothetical protein U0522_00090 [Candidatus Paceibacterota bacterium]
MSKFFIISNTVLAIFWIGMGIYTYEMLTIASGPFLAVMQFLFAFSVLLIIMNIRNHSKTDRMLDYANSIFLVINVVLLMGLAFLWLYSA